MRSRSILILGLAGILTFSACSSATEEKPASRANSTAGTNANTVAIANGSESAPPQAGISDANVTASAAFESGNRPSNRFDKVRKGEGGGGPVGDPREIALKNARPAPDNSTFASYLDDEGYEIRTFKDHPLLSRVEKKIANDGKATLKVFLRNGKVINLPGESISPLSSAPASIILETAGVPTAGAPAAQPGQIQAKKPTE